MIQIHKMINTSECWYRLRELCWGKDKVKCPYCCKSDCHKNGKDKSQTHCQTYYCKRVVIQKV